MRLARRQFLKAMAGAVAAPLIFSPRRARAQSATQAQQLLVIYCQGGMRSNALFTYANAPLQLCPFTTQGSPTGQQFVLASGNPPDPSIPAPFLNTDGFVQAWESKIGTIYSNYDGFGLISPIDHNPHGAPVIDMNVARNYISTGLPAGGVGLLTAIGNHIQAPLPPFAIGDPALVFAKSATGLEAGEPVFVRDPLDIASRISNHPASGALASWETTFNKTLDARQIGQAATFLGHDIAAVANGRNRLALVRQQLITPQFQFGVKGNLDASYQTTSYKQQPLTNRHLEQTFLPFLLFPGSGRPTLNSDYTDPLGVKMCLAVRALQYGSPAVVVGYNDWNLHTNEKTKIQALSVPLGRAIAGLLWVLAGLPGRVQKRKLDEVLVVVVSEFARDNTLSATGFNEQNGSDYRGTNPCRFQSLPVFGAGVKGGKVFGGLSASPDLSPTGQVYSSADLWATMVSALGIDYTPYLGTSATTIDGLFA